MAPAHPDRAALANAMSANATMVVFVFMVRFLWFWLFGREVDPFNIQP